MGRAKTGVLHDGCDRDAWIVRRRKRDVKRMVALMLLQAPSVVFVLLADADGLRGAGLTAAQVGRAGKGAHGSALQGHADHGLFHRVQVSCLVA